MEELDKKVFEKAEGAMEKALDHLKNELVKLRTGKASTNMLADVMVEYYGTPTPLQQVANVQVTDSRTLTIQPWEKTIIKDIERALIIANLGMQPANDGEMIRLMVPPLTEERRAELAKKAKGEGDESKQGIRSARKEALDEIKKAVKDGLSEDVAKRKEDEVQKLVKKYEDAIDQVVSNKQDEIMTV